MRLKEVTLLKPTKDTRWGIIPGRADGHVCVKALHPAGIAREQLRVGDRIVAIDGIAISSEPEVVERLTKAYPKASSKRGVTLTINRPHRGGMAATRRGSSRRPRDEDIDEAERRERRHEHAGRVDLRDAAETPAPRQAKTSEVEASGRSLLRSSTGSHGKSPLEVFEEEQREMMAKVRRMEVHAPS